MASDEAPDISQGRYKRIFGVLFRLTKMVNAGAPLPDLLAAVARNAADLVGAETCAVMLLDETRAELLSKGTHGLTPQEEDATRFRSGEGIAGLVVRDGKRIRVDDVSQDPRFVVFPEQKTTIRSLVCVPLLTREGAIGVIAASSSRLAAFGDDHAEVLAYLGSSIVKDIETARLFRLAVSDPLTRAYNRQFLFQRLPQEIERAQRYGSPFSLSLFDLDGFQRVNAAHGHAAGDFVLKEVVKLMQAQIRDVDVLVRSGGEEFLLLLPSTPLDGARLTAERIGKAVAKAEFPWSEQALKVTVTSGTVQLERDEDDEALLQRADAALDLAKADRRS